MGELEAIHQKLDRILRLLGENLDTPERDTLPAPPVRTTWRKVGLAYRERFLVANRGKVLDYHIQRHQQTWEELARVVDGRANPEEDLGRALDNFFRDAWAQKHRFPPGALVSSFEKYCDYAEPVVKREDEPDPEAINARRLRERKQQDDRELQAKLNGHAATASKPPPLEELMAGIGRVV